MLVYILVEYVELGCQTHGVYTSLDSAKKVVKTKEPGLKWTTRPSSPPPSEGMFWAKNDGGLRWYISMFTLKD